MDPFFSRFLMGTPVWEPHLIRYRVPLHARPVLLRIAHQEEAIQIYTVHLGDPAPPIKGLTCSPDSGILADFSLRIGNYASLLWQIRISSRSRRNPRLQCLPCCPQYFRADDIRSEALGTIDRGVYLAQCVICVTYRAKIDLIRCSHRRRNGPPTLHSHQGKGRAMIAARHDVAPLCTH